MRKVFSKFGFQARRGTDPQVIRLALELEEISSRRRRDYRP